MKYKTILLSIFIGIIIIYLVLEYLWFYLFLSFLITLPLLLHKRGREYLNIIKVKNRVNFYLSEDLILSKELHSSQELLEVINNAVTNELKDIHELITKIFFVNFKDDKLSNELNKLISN